MRLLQAVALVATFAVAWLVGLGVTGLAAPQVGLTPFALQATYTVISIFAGAVAFVSN